jgi:hypothetical protein
MNGNDSSSDLSHSSKSCLSNPNIDPTELLNSRDLDRKSKTDKLHTKIATPQNNSAEAEAEPEAIIPEKTTKSKIRKPIRKIKACKGQRKSKAKRRSESSRFTRRLWNAEEDSAISSLVSEHGIKKWTLISKKLNEDYGIKGRSGKQCRER